MQGDPPCPLCRLRAEVRWPQAGKGGSTSKADKNGLHHLHITLTPEQYQSLSEQAKSCGLSKRAYLIRLMEGRPVKVTTSQEIKDLRWEVHKIGVNINQIARSVNAGIARAGDAKRGLFLLDQVYELMYEIAKK